MLPREKHYFAYAKGGKDQNFTAKFSSKVIKTSSHSRGSTVRYGLRFFLVSMEVIINSYVLQL
jgi:hypothetical protein